MPSAAVLAAVWFFGLPALKVMVYCVAFCMLLEYLWCRLMKQKSTLCDFSAAVTGLILALNLPSHSQWWLCAVGSFVAIIIAKQVFGGLGQNPFNPAAVGRVALLIGFTGPMTTQWVAPTPGAFVGAFDAVTTATPADPGKSRSVSGDHLGNLRCRSPRTARKTWIRLRRSRPRTATGTISSGTWADRSERRRRWPF